MAHHRVKTCVRCGRLGSHMTEIRDWRKTWACRDIWACRKRTAVIGKWTGQRVLRRRDLNGSEWEIRRATTQTGINSTRPLYQLTMTYRDHRDHKLTSLHPSTEAAKAHVDDITESLTARSLDEYASSRA